MTAALRAGSVDHKVVAVEARRAGDTTPAAVVPIGELGSYDRPAPGLGHYDDLLAEVAS